jgi:hypothetical protein
VWSQGGVDVRDHFSCCSFWRPLQLSLSQLFIGMPAPTIVGSCASSPSSKLQLQLVGIDAV